MADREKELKRLLLKVLKKNIHRLTISNPHHAFKTGFALSTTNFRIDIIQEAGVDKNYKKEKYKWFPFIKRKVEYQTIGPKFWFIEFEDKTIQINRAEYEEIEKLYKDHNYKKQVEQLKKCL